MRFRVEVPDTSGVAIQSLNLAPFVHRFGGSRSGPTSMSFSWNSGSAGSGRSQLSGRAGAVLDCATVSVLMGEASAT